MTAKLPNRNTITEKNACVLPVYEGNSPTPKAPAAAMARQDENKRQPPLLRIK